MLLIACKKSKPSQYKRKQEYRQRNTMTTPILLSQLGALRLSGEDATSYLQGQVTSDVTQLNDKNVQLSVHCDGKGKAWSIFHIIKEADAYTLIGEKTSLANTLRELKKYGVFSKVEIQDITDSTVIVGFDNFADTLQHILNESDAAKSSKISNGDVLEVADWHVFQPQYSEDRIIAFTSKETSRTPFWSENGVSKWLAYDARQGLAMLNEQTSGEFVPQMMNLQALEAISFTKGCYMGQETVARTKYLGKNKRAGFAICTTGEHIPVNGAVLEQKMGDSWRRAGTLIYTGISDGETWGFAVLPNDLSSDTQLRLKASPDVIWQAKALPYSLDDAK